MLLSVLLVIFLLLKKCKGFTNYDEIYNFERKLNLRHTTLENNCTTELSTGISLHIFHVIIRLLIPNTIVVRLLYTASEISNIYTEILVQYHSKATDTVCSIKLKREEFLYIRTIFNFRAECVLIYIYIYAPFLPKFQPGCS